MEEENQDKINQLLDDIIGISDKSLYPFNEDDNDRLEMINERAKELYKLLP